MRVYNDRIWLWNFGSLPEGITFEQFMNEHSSCPRNRLIARVFYLAGFIESWGRGIINKIKKEFLDNGMEIPVYKEEMGGMPVYIKRKIDDNISKTSSQKIINLIMENPNISTNDMANIIGIDIRNIARHIKKLQDNGVIIRIGLDKGRHWKIVLNAK